MCESRRHRHELGIAAVRIPTGGSKFRAQVFIAPATRRAAATGGIDPGHSNPISFTDRVDARANAFHASNRLMARHDGQVRRRRAAFDLVELDEGSDGEVLEIESPASSFLLFGHGQPLREPVVAHGPFVMNTQQEILQAIRDYKAGRFGGAP